MDLPKSRTPCRLRWRAPTEVEVEGVGRRECGGSGGGWPEGARWRWRGPEVKVEGAGQRWRALPKVELELEGARWSWKG